MAINKFIPEIWIDKTIERWENEAVFANLVSREYEGPANKGNVVQLTGVVAPTVKDYKAGVIEDPANAGQTLSRTTRPDPIQDTNVDLLIDQEKAFDFLVDDIDRVQAAGSLDDWTNAAGDALVEDSDSFIAAMLATNGTALTAATPTTGNAAWDLIVEARKRLQKAKVPAANRILAVNAEFEALLLRADSKITSFDTSGDANGLRNATLGTILGFRTVSAAHLPSTDKPQFAAFHTKAAAYVSQIDKMEAMRDQDSFSDRIRGLHVYGGKTVKPQGVVVFTGA